ASRTVAVSAEASPPYELPKPTYTGASPSGRKRASGSGGDQVSSRGSVQKPVGRASAGQSAGAGSRGGLQACSTPPCLIRDAGERWGVVRPSCSRRQVRTVFRYGASIAEVVSQLARLSGDGTRTGRIGEGKAEVGR